MFSLLVKNVLVVDGGGRPPQVADIAVSGAEIVAVAPSIQARASLVIDGQGLVALPGFIDLQNHSDAHGVLLTQPGLDSMLLQGVTTIVVGNCGASLAPALGTHDLVSLRKWHKQLGVNIDWEDFHEFLTVLSKKHLGCHVASLVGYGTLRRYVVGDKTEPLTAAEQELVLGLTKQSFEGGALGVSVGLGYSHEHSISELELFELAKLAKKHDKYVSVHLRDESSGILPAVAEIIDVVQRSGVRVKISHLKVRGQENWHLQSEVIETLRRAAESNLPLTFDVYPYDSLWQPLYQYMPAWSVLGGRSVLLSYIHHPLQRQKILTALAQKRSQLSAVVVATSAVTTTQSTKTLGEIAENLNCLVEEALLQVLQYSGASAMAIESCLDPAGVTRLLGERNAMVATDGAGFSLVARRESGVVHPRAFGSFPKFIHDALKSARPVPWSDIARKTSGVAAETAGLTNRGRLSEGFVADLVVLDPRKVNSRATVADPYQSPSGLELVVVSGKVAVKKGVLTGQLNGHVLL